jgi:lysyl-tRNA synthetase class 2
MFPDDLKEQEIVRREKAEDLKSRGIEPFGQKYIRTHQSKDVHDAYGAYDHDLLEEMKPKVSIAGRIMLKRRQGKAGFINVQDKEGQIQVYVRQDHIGEDAYEIFKLSDLGDIIGIEGTVFRTKTGELTIKADAYTHLTKALTPTSR